MKKRYFAPTMEAIEMEIAGMLCSSTDTEIGGDATIPGKARLFDDDWDDQED